MIINLWDEELVIRLGEESIMYKEVIGENERIGKNGKAKCFCCGNYTIDRLFEEYPICFT